MTLTGLHSHLKHLYTIGLYSYFIRCVTAVVLVFVFSVVALCKVCCPAYFYVLVTVCVLHVFLLLQQRKKEQLCQLLGGNYQSITTLTYSNNDTSILYESIKSLFNSPFNLMV